MGSVATAHRRLEPAAALVRPQSVNQLCVTGLGLSVDSHAILTNVSLDVASSEIVGLLGRDGAGKTSCFEAIAGLRRADSGRIFLSGIDVTDSPIEMRARYGLSYLCEEVSIFRLLTVEQNIQIALDAAEPSNSALRHVDEILEAFNIAHVRKQLATSLSGGERRRCEIARAVASDPSIVLLDEPFRGLDPMSIREVMQAVMTLREHGAGVLMSDYNVKGMLDVMDRAYVIHEGHVIFSGGAKEMMESEIVHHLYLGDSNLF